MPYLILSRTSASELCDSLIMFAQSPRNGRFCEEPYRSLSEEITFVQFLLGAGYLAQDELRTGIGQGLSGMFEPEMEMCVDGE
jgi:hypothetical protein